MTEVSPPRYVPILKGKLGEFNALAMMSPATHERLYPLIEVLPGPDPDIDNDTAKAIQTLGQRWYYDPVMIDVGYFDADVEDDAARSPLATAMACTLGILKQPVPVFRLADDEQTFTDLADIVQDHGTGAALRVLADDLDTDPEELSEQIDESLTRVGLSADAVDILIDLGAINGDVAVLGGYRLVQSIVRGIDQFATARSFTVAAGSFPGDLSGVAPWTTGEHPRDDAALYNRMRSRPAKRTIDFGDYAIAHPLLGTGVPFAPPPQLRYAVSDRWLTLKGKRNDPRGNQQFYEVCERIAEHPSFVGEALGEADALIAGKARASGKPGNATTWRTIGTAHHADLVVARLTSLGEP